ncbi:hypothetical protein F5Y14DRAFT_417545 [Nemania sp. NC0429]|nr:hypothetical protein F5Y14DRAFT_417545 [Nemania sp. NC0429]
MHAMRSIIFGLTALAPALVNARSQAPPRAEGLSQIELYTPTITTLSPFSTSQDGQNSSDIKLRCETFGPQCMTFPLGASPNETISVRVYCAAMLMGRVRHQQHLRSKRDNRPTRLSYVLVPALMNPCPVGARCTFTIDENKRPSTPPGLIPAPSPPPSHPPSSPSDVGPAIPPDALSWFENEERVIPALAGEDTSKWEKIDWLDPLASIDSIEPEEQDEDEDGDVKEGSYDGLAGFDIDLGSAVALTVVETMNPRIPPIPKIPWFKFTCYVEDDIEPPAGVGRPPTP